MTASGLKDFQGAVGNTAAVGDGPGAMITINSTGAITFSGDVGIAAGDTATTLLNAVTNLDGLTFTSAGVVTFGNVARTDQVTLMDGDIEVEALRAFDRREAGRLDLRNRTPVQPK